MISKKKNKVVYFVGHYGGFLLSMTHKVTMHKDSEAVFIYVKTSNSKVTNDFVETLTGRDIVGLGKVITMHENLFWNYKTKEETLKAVLEYYDELFEDVGVDINCLNTNIYIQFDEYNSLGIYLGSKKPKATIHFILTAVERFIHNIDTYRINDIPGHQLYSELQKKYRTLDEDVDYVSNVIRTFKIPTGPIKIREDVVEAVKKYEHFDFMKALRELSEEDRSRFIQIFGVDKWSIRDECAYNVLMMSSNFGAFERGTTEEQFIGGNQLLIDYFMDRNNLLIKPHPRADYGKEAIQKVLPAATYLPGYIPSEFLGSIKLKVDTLLTSGSNGGGYLGKEAKKIINVGTRYWFRYEILTRLYICLKMAKYISKHPIYFYGVPSEMVEAFVATHQEFSDIDTSLCLTSLKNVDRDANVIINTSIFSGENNNILSSIELQRMFKDKEYQNNFYFLNQEVFENLEVKNNLLHFEVKKEKVCDEVCENLNDETFCVLPKNVATRSRLADFKMSYTLWNTGISVKVGLADEKQANEDDVSMEYVFQSIMQINKSMTALNYKMNKVLDATSARVKVIDNFEVYINELGDIKKRATIIIAVRDTPGHKLNGKLAGHMKNQLGLKIDLSDKHWHGYGAVIHKGKVIFERDSKDSKVYFEAMLSGNEMIVESAGLKQGNTANILVDDNDYSMNKRGVNIVVFDTMKDLVIDTVCFDTHGTGIPCYRKSNTLGILDI